MKLVHVLPLDKALGLDELDYFGKEELPVGTVVSVPLRRRSIPAVVLRSEDVSAAKTGIKKSSYGLKKISKVLAQDLYSDDFLAAIRKTAEFFACSLGAVLSSVTPSAIFDKPEKTAPLSVSGRSEVKKLILQADDEERFSRYRILVREAFLKKNSVLFLVPTVQDGEKLKEALSKGIEEFTIFLHGDLPKRELRSAWKKSRTTAHSLVFIITAFALSVLRTDTSAIVIERESSPAFKMLSRPFLDFRYLAESLAEKSGIPVIFGDTVLRTETAARFKTKNLEALKDPTWRVLSGASAQIVDMKAFKPDLNEHFTMFSPEALNALRQVKNQNGHAFVFVARKGLAPTTVCGDCGSVLLCDNCGAPLVLHRNLKNERYFLCHRCGDKKDSTLRCKKCTSWKLVMLGVGVSGVLEELGLKLPDIKTFRMDGETVRTRLEAKAASKEFFESPGSILVGTELALQYLSAPVTNSVIASIDSLLSIPDFKINERIMNIISRIRMATRGDLIIQTRQADSSLLKFAALGDLSSFYDSELEMRQQFEYPPFSVFIKIALPGSQSSLAEMTTLKEKLKPAPFYIFPAMSSRLGGAEVLYGLLKVPSGKWPDEKILAILRSLPPNFQIDVDPGNIL